MNKRWWLWIALLGVGGWLALFGDKSPASDSVVQPSPAPPAPATAHSRFAAERTEAADALVPLVPRDALIAKPQGSEAGGSSRDLFSSRSWSPPPPPPAPAPPAPPPVAPALPYTFVGKKLEGSSWEVYLTRSDRTFIVREGQLLEGSYRVDKIEPPALTLTYLPLEQAQTLAIGETR